MWLLKDEGGGTSIHWFKAALVETTSLDTPQISKQTDKLDNYRFQCYKENKQGDVMEPSRRPAKLQQLLITYLMPDSTQSAYYASCHLILIKTILPI